MFRITERPIGGVMILDLAGRMSHGDPEIVLRDKVEAVAQRWYRHVVVNLGGVSGSDASTISALLACHTLMRDAHGELKLLHLTRRITNLLIIVALYGYFQVFDSEPEALASFEPRSSVERRRRIDSPAAGNVAAVA